MKKILSVLPLLWAVLSFGSVAAENYPYRNDVLWVTVPDHADWLYTTGERAKVDVALYLYGVPSDGTEVSYEIGPDMMPAAQKGTVRLKNGRATIDIGTMRQPGFLDLRLQAQVGQKRHQHHVKVGFSPERLTPYTENPKDFDQFWQQTLDEARRQPVDVVSCERVEKYETADTECFLVKLKTDRQHYVYGYLTKPRLKGSYPVVLCPPGAGVKTIKEPMRHIYYAQNGFIRLEMEIHGLHPELPQSTFDEINATFGGVNGYLQNGLDDRDNYYMRHVYTACVRCIDYLCSQPEWDGRNAFVQGGSQGGALALVTAALDSRVTACVANHPALSDMVGYLANRAGGYPHFNNQHQMLTPQKVHTLQYYDVVNFARRIKCPVRMTWGYNDNTCPPTTSYIVWNLLQCPKEPLITPINEHWTSEDTERGHMMWLKKMKK